MGRCASRYLAVGTGHIYPALAVAAGLEKPTAPDTGCTRGPASAVPDVRIVRHCEHVMFRGSQYLLSVTEQAGEEEHPDQDQSDAPNDREEMRVATDTAQEWPGTIHQKAHQ